MIVLLKESGLFDNRNYVPVDFTVVGVIVTFVLYVCDVLGLDSVFNVFNEYFWEYASATVVAGLVLLVGLLTVISLIFQELRNVAVRFDTRLGGLVQPIVYLFLGSSLSHFLFGWIFGAIDTGIGLGASFAFLAFMCVVLRLFSTWVIQFAGRKKAIGKNDAINIGFISLISFVAIYGWS